MGACLGSMVATCACQACCKVAGCMCMASPMVTVLLYCAIFTLSTIAALVLRFEHEPLSICVDASGDDCKGFLSSTSSITYSLCGNEDCAGQWAVYRISFTLFAMFSVLLVLSTYPSKFA